MNRSESASEPAIPPILAFEGFYLDSRQRVLFRADGEILPLPSRAFDTLLYMARHPHELLDKERLMKAVWPQAVVEENNLSQNISLLRKVLGEQPGEHRFIVTIPARGFRFVPVVRELSGLPWVAAQGHRVGGNPTAPVPESPDAPGPRASQASRYAQRSVLLALAAGAVLLALVAGYLLRDRGGASTQDASIAVLAFADLSPTRDQSYFSEGLSEELINQLAQIPHLRVIGRSSSFLFNGGDEDPRRIGELLGVNHILQGSVRKSGNRIRVTAKLIDPADGAQGWSATYERDLDDVFAIQDEIAHAVASQLHLKMDARDQTAGGTRDVAAYDEFLAGRSKLASNDEATLLAAAPHFERALRIDPAFMAARLWLVDAYLRTLLSSAELKDSAIRRQDEIIDEVVALAPGTPEASFALSYRAARGRDLVELGRLLKEATQVPGSAGERARMRYGQFLLGTGNTIAAEQELEDVARNDPLNDFVRTQLLLALDIANRPAEAAQEIERFLRTPGGNAPSIHGVAIRMAQGQRDQDRLARAVQAAIGSGNVSGDAAAALRKMVDSPEEALADLRQLAQDSALQGNVYFASNIAQDAAFLGDRKLALEGLRALFRGQFTFETTAFVLWRPVVRDLRGDPEFRDIVRELGLEDYWRMTGSWGDFCKPESDEDFVCS